MPRLLEIKKEKAENGNADSSSPDPRNLSPSSRHSAFTLVASSTRGELLNSIVPASCSPYIWPALHGLFLPYLSSISRPRQIFSPERAKCDDESFTPEKATIGNYLIARSMNRSFILFFSNDFRGISIKRCG